MKKYIVIVSLIFTSLSLSAQILLEDKDGDVIVRNQFRPADNTSLIKLNTGEQSLGFNYITSTKANDENNYRINEFGVKARPTEGYATVFSNGQFSPGLKVSYALTKLRIFSSNITDPFIDWGTVEAAYDINRYTLFKRDTVFQNQFYSKNFKALSVLLTYNYLVQKGDLSGKLLLNVKAGISRRNNYDDLRPVEVQDVTTIVDPATATSRQIIRRRTAKEGRFDEFDAYPLIFSATKLTQTDPPASPEASRLRFGYTLYLKSLVSNALPQTTAGLIFFLTKQDRNGVREPVLGLNIQAEDPFDVYGVNNGLQNRLTVGFTTIFSL